VTTTIGRRASEAIAQRRRVYQACFGTPEGKTVLADILNRCGLFDRDAGGVKPELIALANHILGSMGSLEEDGLSQIMDAYLAAAAAAPKAD